MTFVEFITDLAEKARCRKSAGHVIRESDSSMVPKKPANNGSSLPADFSQAPLPLRPPVKDRL